MTSRRRFLAGSLAFGTSVGTGWAEAGNPAYLAAARMQDGRFRLFGLDAGVRPVFSLPLPGRGHAAAAHPVRAQAVAFARRPGTFALVLDCVTGRVLAHLAPPAGHHFYGHGVFSRDGARLYTTENAFELGAGRIGIWAVDEGYRRIGDMASGGIGPHDIARLPGTETLVVANGGIDTHPDTGREKLNLPTMRANLGYVDAAHGLVERVELPREMRLNSIRHLDVRADGLVAFGCQWQGDLAEVPPLLGLHRLGQGMELLAQTQEAHRRLNGYVGSTAFSGDGRQIAVTAPRGDRLVVFDVESGTARHAITEPDICGVAASAEGLAVTTGAGRSGLLGEALHSDGAIAWDNHLVALTPQA